MVLVPASMYGIFVYFMVHDHPSICNVNEKLSTEFGRTRVKIIEILKCNAKQCNAIKNK